MTKKSQTNLIDSTTSATENIPQEKTVCRANKTNKMVSTVKARTAGKINSIAKSLFTVPTTKKLNIQIN